MWLAAVCCTVILGLSRLGYLQGDSIGPQLFGLTQQVWGCVELLPSIQRLTGVKAISCVSGPLAEASSFEAAGDNRSAGCIT